MYANKAYIVKSFTQTHLPKVNGGKGERKREMKTGSPKLRLTNHYDQKKYGDVVITKVNIQ